MASTKGKKIVIPDIRYTPSYNRRLRLTGKHKTTSVKRMFTATLKYYTYRDDKDGDHISQQTNKFERWNDRGLGNTWRQIQSSCEQFASKHVTAWSLVLAPAPDLFSIIDKASRHELMRDFTDNVILAYFEARDLPTPDYSFVLHEATTKPTSENGEIYPFTHSHIVIPGTIQNDATNERIPFYNNSSKGDIELWHQIADQEMEKLLDRELAQEMGINWRFLAGREVEIEPVLEVPLDSGADILSPALDTLYAGLPQETNLDYELEHDAVRELDPDLEDTIEDIGYVDFDMDD